MKIDEATLMDDDGNHLTLGHSTVGSYYYLTIPGSKKFDALVE
jgi:hypothetical protein